MKDKPIAVVAGGLLTLILWAIAYVVLNAVFRGSFFSVPIGWVLVALAAVLCPLAGGYTAARLSGTRGLLPGVLSGLSAGLVALLTSLLVGVLAGRLAPNMTLAGIGLVVLGAIGGGMGTLLSPGQRARKLRQL
jgi:hypothetical protein